MWLWVKAQAKQPVDLQAIATKRQEWLRQGKDQQLRQRCRSAQRFVVRDSQPTEVFWLLETDDPTVVRLITDHFGSLWKLETCEVVVQPIAEALSESPSR